MKIRKIITGGLMAVFTAAPPVLAQDTSDESLAFLQTIQNSLSRASGLKDNNIVIHVTTEKKRIFDVTPSAIHYSYGFLKQMENIDQLVATMAHMTAHISLDYLSTPPLPEEDGKNPEKPSVGDYLKSVVRPKYPDENNIPEATGSFRSKDRDPGMGIIERPGYQNRAYDYAVNKSDVIKAERELDTDKTAIKILKHAGFCPTDYNRMLRYFYENPHLLLGNRHFALDADQWQRLDILDRNDGITAPCNDAQKAMSQQYVAGFDQLKVKIYRSLKGN
ncbi:hypothetical protein MNBD_ALPHA01-606 [hydrothermal vent metagenome]|uniref:Uncharacterized protein n=1 Tax=hydrothermal vent metagenome TaxID=652676 RepID=A0A3B0SGT7_9ZZZZ